MKLCQGKENQKKAKRNLDYNSIWFPHQSGLITLESKNAPKSPYYRSKLESLLLKNAEMIGLFKFIRKNTIYRTKINQIMLSDIDVFCDGEHHRIDHIWITVEKGFTQRNKIKQNQKAVCDGYFYEYLSHNTRNIGFRLIYIKPYCEKERIVNNIISLLMQLTDDDDMPTIEEDEKPVEMLTIKECTDVISGLSEHTVRKLVTQNKVKHIRTGEGKRGKILVNKADLIAYFQS